LVSVVIPVKNGDYWLNDTLNGLMGQKIDGHFEIIIIDSGSTDKSLEIIKRFPVRLIQVESNSFNHGLTRNLGVREASGEYVAMTVQDARPCDEYWLQNLLKGFVDGNVAGVCGQQVVPHDADKNPMAWFRPQSASQLSRYEFTPEQFAALTPEKKRLVCGWDDVTAMYRKKALIQVPFREVMFAEDVLWAKDALLNGYAVVYNSAARVYHYHFENPDQVMQRAFTEYFHFYKFLGYVPLPVSNNWTRKLKDIKLLMKERQLAMAEKWKWYRYNQRLRKKINEAVALFHESLSQGEASLEATHKRLSQHVQAAKPVHRSEKI
jgi:rhamnosyltransferase